MGDKLKTGRFFCDNRVRYVLFICSLLFSYIKPLVLLDFRTGKLNVSTWD